MNRVFIIIGGILNGLLFIFHLLFWKLFNWPEALMYMTPDDRALMQVFNIHGSITIGLFAYVSLFHRKELLTTKLGRVILAVIALFYYVHAINSIIFWNITIPEELIILVLVLIIGLLYT
ncbi:hypothetical protein KKH18_08585, partial [bacterium]|nr:hypothetical protein [bacterium]